MLVASCTEGVVMADIEKIMVPNGQWDDGRTVLVVEDEPSLRMVITRTLARRGHRPIAVDTVRGAIAEMTARLPDVVLLGVNLPDGTGWEVLRWLRSAHLHIPVIVYSAVPPSAKRVAEFHPDAVLTKPFPIDCLLDLVATVGMAEQVAQ
jgi:DNA-binding response OmpR family regulator